jgi:Fe-S oxidoreductase
LALSRPDISDGMFDRKECALQAALAENPRRKQLLTNCPSCLQGLGRQERLGVRVRHLSVALAEASGGPEWARELQGMTRKAEIVTF